MTPQEQIRKLAEDLVPENIYGPVGREKAYQREDIVSWVCAATLEGVKLALAEPSEEWLRDQTGSEHPDDQEMLLSSIRDFSAYRLRELGVEE